MNAQRLNTTQPLRRDLLIGFVVLLFLLGIFASTRGIAQEITPPANSVNTTPQLVSTPVVPDTSKFVRSYISLGLSLASMPAYSFLGLSELSLNYTAYMKWGAVAEIGINARNIQGIGGHILIGQTVMEHEGWRIFPFIKAGIQQRGGFWDFDSSPAYSFGAGLGVDYEIPNTRLLIGARGGFDLSRTSERMLSSGINGQPVTFPSTFFGTPNMQLRIGWRIGD